MRSELKIANKTAEDAKEGLTRNCQIIEEMRVVKDKYERINQMLKEQLKNMESAHNQATNELSRKRY
jgi:hypothetical protein